MNSDRLWLSQLAPALPDTLKTPLDVARAELAYFPEISVELCLQEDMHEQWVREKKGSRVLLRGGTPGLLYAAYQLIFSHLAHQAMPEGIQSPAYPLRMLNCWDNLSGHIERGYAGRSLFFEDGRVCYDPDRIRTLARLLASCGINTLCSQSADFFAGLGFHHHAEASEEVSGKEADQSIGDRECESNNTHYDTFSGREPDTDHNGQAPCSVEYGKNGTYAIGDKPRCSGLQHHQ